MTSHPRHRLAARRGLVLSLLGLAVLVGIGGVILTYQRSYVPAPTAILATNLVQNAPYTVTVTPSSQPRVGRAVRLHFTVRKEGVISDIYQEEKILHYVIASANYRDFFHTFAPDEEGPGQFYLDHTFTQPGRYRIWTELVDTTATRDTHHGEHAELVSYVDLNVQGSRAEGGVTPIAATDAWAGAWHVVTEREGQKAGSPTKIRLHVENQEGDILPVFPEEPAIYVMTGPDLTFFRHDHTQPAVDGKFIEIQETFPAAGSYLFFTEIYVRDGDVYQAVQVPFELVIQ